MSETITKDTNLKELISKYPESARLFSAYGIGCIGCALAHYETIEQGLTAHGINVDEFVKELNEYIKNK